MKKLIQVKNIKKSFGNKVILEDINFDLFQGDRIALIGANGSGKSTLVEIILQTLEKTSGEVIYDFNPKDAYKHIGTQFQEANYPSGLKVNDVINFFADIYLIKDKNYLNNLISGFKLNDLLKVKIGGLSGGQLQRLNIMLALIHKPQILILDEITNGLDIKARQEIKNYLKKFVDDNNLTLIIISHNVEEIDALANKVLYLNQGVIQDNYEIEEIKKQFGSLIEYTNQIFGGENE